MGGQFGAMPQQMNDFPCKKYLNLIVRTLYSTENATATFTMGDIHPHPYIDALFAIQPTSTSNIFVEYGRYPGLSSQGTNGYDYCGFEFHSYQSRSAQFWPFT